jgi:hypothetical protein
MQENDHVKNLGEYGAILALMEVGAGSLIHGLAIPFGGHFLSLNQGYLLSRAVLKTNDPSLAIPVSNIAAVLKSFSPAGKKFGPMLSLSIQGFLFRLGLILGVNRIGIVTGMILLSFWGFIQPFITYYLLFGKTLILAASFWVKEILQIFSATEETLLSLIITVILLKAILAIVVGLLSFRKKNESLAVIESKKLESKPAKGSPFLLALRDLTKPLFLISLLLTGIFIYFTQHEWTEVLWYLLRPIGIGFIFFYFSRTLTLDRLIWRMRGSSFESFGKGLEIALTRVRKIL